MMASTMTVVGYTAAEAVAFGPSPSMQRSNASMALCYARDVASTVERKICGGLLRNT